MEIALKPFWGIIEKRRGIERARSSSSRMALIRDLLAWLQQHFPVRHVTTKLLYRGLFIRLISLSISTNRTAFKVSIKVAIKNEMHRIPVTMIDSTIADLPNTWLPAILSNVLDVTSNTLNKLSADFSLLPINKESTNN